MFIIRNHDIIIGINAMGISKLSKIQALAFPDLLNGRDNMTIVSDTGTGKTLVFAIAAVNSVNANNPKLQVLCICATHENAIQTANVIQRVAIYTQVTIGMAVKGSMSSYYV